VDVVFDEQFVTALVYKNKAYREALLTRPINDPITTFDHITDTTGDITSTSLPFASTSLEEENYIEATTSELDENTIFFQQKMLLKMNP